MKARINKNLTFDAEFIENALSKGLGMSDLVMELKTTPNYIEKRIVLLYDADSGTKLGELYENDELKRQQAKHQQTKDAKKAPVSAPLAEEPHRSKAKGLSLNTIEMELPTPSNELDGGGKDLVDEFVDFMANNLESGLRYALEQLEADEAVGEGYCKADTSVSRAALKKLETEIKAAEKALGDSQHCFSAAQVAKTEAEDRLVRAEEKLRRVRNEATHAAIELESATEKLHSEKHRLECLRKKRDQMQKEIENTELPSFSIVPHGNCIVLLAVNYDTRNPEVLESALKWSRRIGERFADLTDSQYAVLGRLFGILSKLKGKYRLEIDPTLTSTLEVFDAFKGYFAR